MAALHTRDVLIHPGTRSSREEEVLAVHETFWQAYARRDLDLRFSVCSPEVTFFGTGLHERAVGIEQYRRMNSKGVEQFPFPFEIRTLWHKITVSDDNAWVESDTLWIQLVEEDVIKEVVRMTTIFRRESGAWRVIHVHGSKPDYRLNDGEYMTGPKIIHRNRELEELVRNRTKDLELERAKSESLLRNILPDAVARELKEKGSYEPKAYHNVTVLFTDFVNFTCLSERLPARELVTELHEHFTAFDDLLDRFNLEKIKTVGDAYLAVSGMPTANADHAVDVVKAAIAIREFVRQRKIERGENSLEIRIGVHSGDVIAGIVGRKKFAYDIWGDTVNTAARMEQHCEAGMVNISEATYELVKGKIDCTFRGEIEAKNKGQLRMYYATETSAT